MSAKLETASNAVDKIKWALVAGLLLAAVVGNHLYANDMSVAIRAIVIIALILAAAFVASKTMHGALFLDFSKESRTEVRKVVWPTRKETMNTTMVVIAATVVMALVLWGLDAIFVRIVGLASGIGV